MSARTCESCGGAADLELPDRSLWCIACDVSARRLGYDNAPARMLRRRQWWWQRVFGLRPAPELGETD